MAPLRPRLLPALPGLVTLVLILGGGYVLHARLEAAREAQQGLRTAVVQLQGAVQALDVQMTSRMVKLGEATERLTHSVDDLSTAISTPAE